MSRLTLLVILIFSGITYAQEAASAPSAAYDFAIGRWECRELSPEGKLRSTFTQQVDKPGLGDWFRWQYFSQKYSNTSYQIYQPNAHQWRWITIFDGGYSMGTAPDFVHNRQTWTGVTYFNNGKQRRWGPEPSWPR